MSDALDLPRCPFRNPLISRDFQCESAEEITRREGPDIGCLNADVNSYCREFFERVKAVTLSALDMEDDLTQVPAGTLSKIQYGSLLALARQKTPGAESVDNIQQLITQSVEQDAAGNGLALDHIVDTIKEYKLKRRRGR